MKLTHFHFDADIAFALQRIKKISFVLLSGYEKEKKKKKFS